MNNPDIPICESIESRTNEIILSINWTSFNIWSRQRS